MFFFFCRGAWETRQLGRRVCAINLTSSAAAAATGDSSTTCLLSHTQNLLGLPQSQAPTPQGTALTENNSYPLPVPVPLSVKWELAFSGIYYVCALALYEIT